MTSDLIFAGHYDPKGNAGTSIVKYTFFNESDPDDNVFFLAHFIIRATPRSLSMHLDGTEVENGQSVYIYGEMLGTQFEEFLAYMLVKNNSDREILVKARREDIEAVSGSYNYLCWVDCFANDVNESPNADTLSPGEMTSDLIFAGHYDPKGNAGTSIVKYTFFNESDPDDNVFFLAHFIIRATPRSLSMHLDGTEVENGQSVYIYGEMLGTQFEEFLAYMLVKNNSDREILVKARREDIEAVSGSYNYLCWVDCFANDVNESPNADTLSPGEMTSDQIFAGHYAPNGNPGTSIVKYTFFNANDRDDNIFFIAHFVISPTSVDDILAKSVISDVYPNPASQNVTFDYDLPVEVKSAGVTLFNLLGQKVVSQSINDFAGKLQINVSDLPEGVYFYSLTLNQQIAVTKKLIIRR
jgi:hypothetical protein